MVAVTGVSNASSGDAPHRINEVSMLVSTRWIRRFWEDRLFCAFMAYPSSTEFPYLIKVAIGIVSSGTTWSVLSPPLPTGLFDQGDPALAANPGASGFHPRRTYLAGRSWDPGSGKDEITVWHLDGVDTAWAINADIGYNTSTGIAADNPAIAVSQYSTSLGHVYLAYIEKGGPQQIVHFYRNPGTDVWSEALLNGVPVYSNSDALNSLRLDVDPTGVRNTIYLSWVDWTAGTVNVMTSTDGGDHWTGPQANTASTFINSNQFIVNYNAIFSPTFLGSAFNPYDGSLAVVYHRRKTPGLYDSEVLMEKYSTASGFSGAQVVSSLSSQDDRWQPAVDCSSTTGRCMVAYYDHPSGDPSDTKYNVYDRLVESNGASVTGENDVLLYGTASDASSLLSHRMEFHDVFYYNGQWLTADVVATPSENTSDVVVTFQ